MAASQIGSFPTCTAAYSAMAGSGLAMIYYLLFKEGELLEVWGDFSREFR
jgi:hypothetical protein